MKKYYTAYLSDPFGQSGGHVTHKYLGRQRDDSLAEIICIIDKYKEYGGFDTVPDAVEFSVRANFGPGQNIPVLLPHDPSGLKQQELRTLLDAFMPDDYGTYEPHLTTNLEFVRLPLNWYALMHKDNVLRLWALIPKFESAGDY